MSVEIKVLTDEPFTKGETTVGELRRQNAPFFIPPLPDETRLVIEEDETQWGKSV